MALLPIPHQLRLARAYVARHGGAVAWVIIDPAAGRCLAEPHPLRPGIEVTLAWESQETAEGYRRRLKLPPGWRTWPTATGTLDAGATEETRRGRPAAWAWKRDSRPPRVQLDHIDPATGEIRRGWWGQPAPTIADEISAAPALAEWSLDRAAHHLGRWLQRGAPEE